MSQIVVDCPHCAANSLGMPVFGIHIPSIEAVRVRNVAAYFDVAAICGKCGKPIAARIKSSMPDTAWNDFENKAKRYANDLTGTPEQFGLKAFVVTAEHKQPIAPNHLPAQIEKSFLMAERNFRSPDNEEAAAAMYRRAIDLSVKTIDPDGKGDLVVRINRLAETGILPGTMKDWAHQVRIIGNDGAHDIDGVTRADLEAAQGFTDALLRYLFTLPKEVALRRAATERTPAPSTEGAG